MGKLLVFELATDRGALKLGEDADAILFTVARRDDKVKKAARFSLKNGSELSFRQKYLRKKRFLR